MGERGSIHDLDLLATARRVFPGGALGTFLPPADLEFVVAGGQGLYINLAAQGYMSLAHSDGDLAETLRIFDESLAALG